jgi:hypothetical protein
VTSRNLTEICALAPHSPCADVALPLQVVGRMSGIALDLYGATEVSKTPYNISDLKLAGQYIDKDLDNTDAIPPLRRKTLLDNGSAHGRWRAATEYTMAENMYQAAWNPDWNVACPASRPLSATDGAVGRFSGAMRDFCDGGVIASDAWRGGCGVELSDADLEKRRAAEEPRGPAFGSGYLWTFAREVGPARHGAATRPGEPVEKTCHADI